MKLNKKAEYDFKDIAWIAVTLGVGIMILSVATTIIGDIRESHPRPGVAIDNESDAVNLIWGNNTNMTLDNQEVSVAVIINCSNGGIISPTVYTVYSFAGQIQCNDNDSSTPDGTEMCVNYSYLSTDSVYNLTIKGEQGTIKLSNWLPTIGVIIGAVIVIGVLFTLGFIKKG